MDDFKEYLIEDKKQIHAEIMLCLTQLCGIIPLTITVAAPLLMFFADKLDAIQRADLFWLTASIALLAVGGYSMFLMAMLRHKVAYLTHLELAVRELSPSELNPVYYRSQPPFFARDGSALLFGVFVFYLVFLTVAAISKWASQPLAEWWHALVLVPPSLLTVVGLAMNYRMHQGGHAAAIFAKVAEEEPVNALVDKNKRADETSI